MSTKNTNKAKISKIANIVLKIAIVVFGLYFLYKKLFFEKDIEGILASTFECFNTKRQTLFVAIAFLLMPLNWLCEAIKWQLLTKKLEKISLFKSYISVLVGVSVGMFLPNHIGDLFGKVFCLEKGNHIKALMLNIIAGLAQLFCTIIFGCIAILFFVPNYYELHSNLSVWIYLGIIVLAIFVITLCLLFYFNMGLLGKIRRIVRKKHRPKIDQYIEVFSYYSKRELLKILFLSAFRYLVFSFQYILLIWAFKVPVNYFEALMLIAILYFVMVFIPSLAITDPAVKGPVSIYIFDKWFVKKGMASLGMMVFSASTLIWVINLAIPALIGFFFVYQLKFFRKEHE